MAASPRAHDCLVNVHFGDAEQPEYMFRVKDEYFKRDDSIFGKWDMAKVLDEMDANGVQRAVLTASISQAGGSPVKFAEARPDRFALTAGGFNFLKPMPSIRLLHYMRTRGKTKVIFASDAPVLSITRTIGEAMALDLPEQVRDNYLYGNAQRFFFGRLSPQGDGE